MKKNAFLLAMIFSIALILSGCGTFFLNSDTGTLALYLADNPGDVDKVNVVLDRVEVKRTGEQWYIINDFGGEGKTESFDLLSLRNTEALLGEKELPAGKYTQIRLIVGAPEEGDPEPQDLSKTSHILLKDGEKIPLFIPSGMQTGLKINYNFVVEDYITELILDVDVEKLIEAGKSDKYILHPTQFIFVIDKAVTGEISGTVLENGENNGTEIIETEITVTAFKGENGEKIASAFPENNPDNVNEIPVGFFKIRGLSESIYKLEITGEGFETKTLDGIQVEAGKTTGLGDIYIQKE